MPVRRRGPRAPGSSGCGEVGAQRRHTGGVLADALRTVARAPEGAVEGARLARRLRLDDREARQSEASAVGGDPSQVEVDRGARGDRPGEQQRGAAVQGLQSRVEVVGAGRLHPDRPEGLGHVVAGLGREPVGGVEVVGVAVLAGEAAAPRVFISRNAAPVSR